MYEEWLMCVQLKAQIREEVCVLVWASVLTSHLWWQQATVLPLIGKDYRMILV
jgi:hypothetical protein